MITATFFYPVFTEHLNIKFGLSIEVSSIFFVISMASYFATIQYLNKISSKFGVKFTIVIGLFINFLSVPLLSPANFLPQNLFTVILGLIILGATGACITIPSIIDIINSLRSHMQENSANDISSGMNY